MQPHHESNVDYSAMSGDNSLPPAVRLVDEQIRGELMRNPLDLEEIQ
jgi:hypothetical protein|tara:strand:+ start:691 stop:831 length:141 start_codon:yes stop_codon:yes gene_type:complete